MEDFLNKYGASCNLNRNDRNEEEYVENLFFQNFIKVCASYSSATRIYSIDERRGEMRRLEMRERSWALTVVVSLLLVCDIWLSYSLCAWARAINSGKQTEEEEGTKITTVETENWGICAVLHAGNDGGWIREKL